MAGAVVGYLTARRGTELPQSKLTEEDIQHIREIHAWKQAEVKRLNDTCGIQALAEKFNVHPRTIEKALRYASWRHVL